MAKQDENLNSVTNLGPFKLSVVYAVGHSVF